MEAPKHVCAWSRSRQRQNWKIHSRIQVIEFEERVQKRQRSLVLHLNASIFRASRRASKALSRWLDRVNICMHGMQSMQLGASGSHRPLSSTDDPHYAELEVYASRLSEPSMLRTHETRVVIQLSFFQEEVTHKTIIRVEKGV